MHASKTHKYACHRRNTYLQAAKFALRMRRSSLYTPALSDKPLYKSGKLQKIPHPEESAPLTDDELGIRRADVRPLPRHRVDAIVVDA